MKQCTMDGKKAIAAQIAEDTGINVYWSETTRDYHVEAYRFHFADTARKCAENIAKNRK